MKKTKIVLIMGIVFSVVITKAIAQPGTSNINTSQTETFTYANEGNAVDLKSMENLTKASTRALSNFKKTFKHEPNAKWFAEPKVITASFSDNDVQTKVVYDKKGHWRWTMNSYQENKMPEDVRSLVKRSIYFDYDITLVQQIQEGDITVYIVHLENGKKYKQIGVYDGEINVIQEFDQQ